MVVRVDKDRLWSMMKTQGQFGGSDEMPGVLERPPLSDTDKAVRDWFYDALEVTGLDVRVDEMGNIFGHREGTDPDAAPILTGSHLDSVGGKFDGSLGVVAALEVVKTLEEEDIETRHPIEIVDWTNEERSRYSPAMLSSGVWAGAYDIKDVYAQTDDQGLTFESELERIGYKGDIPAKPQTEYKAFVELHTEQGPYLDSKNKDIGIVSNITGWHRGEITFHGEADHPGPTPMAFRHDPVVAMADIVTQIRRLAGVTSKDAVGTVSRIDIDPDDIRFIADSVSFTWDVRDPDPEKLNEMVNRILTEVEAAAERESVDWEWREIVSQSGVECSETCVDAIHRAADGLGYDSTQMSSMALHDARHVADVTDTAMIFSVAEDGLSHNPKEYTNPEDCYKATNTLANALVDLADGEV